MHAVHRDNAVITFNFKSLWHDVKDITIIEPDSPISGSLTAV